LQAEFLQIHPKNPEPRKIQQIVECLQSGGIIVYPTDTVYAMGCDIYNTRAIEKLCKIKGIKPQKANFSFICSDLSHIADFAKVSNNAFKLMKKALPGPFTFILNATTEVPKILNTNKKTIGIRVPQHEITRMIVEELGHPIITTSIKDDRAAFRIDDINEYPNDIEIIYEMFKNTADIVIDGGWCGIIPSTVVDATDNEILVVREGLGDLEEFL
jgi:tRNA threonylcarbamoyl adenosine modification protein (Sua5/YciO/YrdC/YwlC family)